MIIQGYKYQIDLGVKFLETDVRLTKDGQLIFCHDDNFLRLCGVNKKVRETNLEDLPQFLPKIPLHFSKYQYLELKETDQKTFSTVEEVFQKIPKEVLMQIDVKDGCNQDAQKELIRLIKKYNREKTTIVGSETIKNCNVLYQEGEDIPKCFCYEVGLSLLLAYYLGLLPFMRIKEDVNSSPYMTRDYLRMKLEDGRTKSWLFYAQIVVMFIGNITTNQMMMHLNKRGVFTDYWVLNDEDEMRKVIRDHPVQGIMTDRPSTLKRVLQEEKFLQNSGLNLRGQAEII